MLMYRDLVGYFRQFGLGQNTPVIVHASLSAFGEVRGGAETLLGALLSNFNAVMMPTFTPRCEIIPEVGPEDNGLVYGSGRDANLMAEFFTPDLPAHPMMGVLAETLRKRSGAQRSAHPLLSFAGVNVNAAIEAQTLDDPFAPIGVLSEQGGWVLLLGVDHSVNTSIHYAEKLTGRKRFVRWALTPQGIVECRNYPGCSDGFQQAGGVVAPFTRVFKVGNAVVQATPLKRMLDFLTTRIKSNPQFLLCNRSECPRCDSVRHSLTLQAA